MQTIDLNYGGKVNLWFEKNENLRVKEKKIIKKQYKTPIGDIPLREAIIAEILLPRGGRNLYGLLGIEYEGHDSDSLEIILNASDMHSKQKVFDRSLIAKIEPTFIGLQEEYAEYILRSIEQIIISEKLKLKGKLMFSFAAFTIVSSNGWIFGKLAEILLNGLFWPIENINKETIQAIINKKQ